jgi:hypothetical protein
VCGGAARRAYLVSLLLFLPVHNAPVTVLSSATNTAAATAATNAAATAAALHAATALQSKSSSFRDDGVRHSQAEQ